MLYIYTTNRPIKQGSAPREGLIRTRPYQDGRPGGELVYDRLLDARAKEAYELKGIGTLDGVAGDLGMNQHE